MQSNIKSGEFININNQQIQDQNVRRPQQQHMNVVIDTKLPIVAPKQISLPPSTSSKSSTLSSSSSFGHDRQPSVQLKIESTGGPPYFATKTTFCEKFSRNIRYLLSQLIILVSQLSPIVQSLSGLIILLYLIQFGGEITVDFFALIPGEIISPGQWYHTAVAIWSHSFLETRLILIIIDLLVLSFCGTLIEPLWGQKEVLRFMLITIIPSSLLTCIHYIILYCLTFDETFLFNIRVNGFQSFCAAMAVTVKQLLPQSVLISTSFGRFKNDHIAFTVIVIAIIFYMFNMLNGVKVLMLLYGMLTSWLYLRFWQAHIRHSMDSATTITRGDLSDSFAFETFFPNVLRPLVSILSNNFYNFFVRLNLCPRIPSAAAQLLNENSLSSTSSSMYYHRFGSSSTSSISPKYYPQSSSKLSSSSFLQNGQSSQITQPLLENL